jgi:Putative collagen-binding domain of a collagenase
MTDHIYDKLSGTTIRAYWYDPRNGTSQLIGEFDKSTFHDFTPPTSGHGNDWVLVLDDAAKGYAAPGKAANSVSSGGAS